MPSPVTARAPAMCPSSFWSVLWHYYVWKWAQHQAGIQYTTMSVSRLPKNTSDILG